MYKSKYFKYDYDPKVKTNNQQLSENLTQTKKDWVSAGYTLWKQPLNKLPTGIHIRYIANVKGTPKARLGGTITVNNTDKSFLLLKHSKTRKK